MSPERQENLLLPISV